MKSYNFHIASFPLIMAILTLMLLGMALSPLLKVKLLPDRSLPAVTVYFTNCTLKCRRQFQSLQWLMPMLQQRSRQSNVKDLPDGSQVCDIWLLNRYYSYGGANAVVADSEVTSRLEAVFSNLEGLVNMRSRTADGSGDITLEMEKGADVDAVRFEVSMLIRQVYPNCPLG